MELKIMYFVHGTTTDNASGKCSGWKQVELNELGRERAIKLGELQKDKNFDVIFMRQARLQETAGRGTLRPGIPCMA